MNSLNVMRFFRTLLITLLISIPAMAVDFYIWETGQTVVPFVLPVKKGETPEQAAEKYLKLLKKNPDLVELFEGRTPLYQNQKFTKLRAGEGSKVALLIANKVTDYTLEAPRIYEFQRVFKSSGHQSFVLPMNINLGYSLSETRELFDSISKEFSLMVSMGGDDVHTELYKQVDFHAKYTNKTRDQFEMQLIKSYVNKGAGFFLGICRGSQLASVALGYKLIQDLPFHKGEAVSHGDSWHAIKVKPTTNGILSSVMAPHSLHNVNSLHHQSVVFREGGPLELAAQSADGTVEATEFKNGKGLLLQFHPEFMKNELADNLFKKIVEVKQRIHAPRCSKIFL